MLKQDLNSDKYLWILNVFSSQKPRQLFQTMSQINLHRMSDTRPFRVVNVDGRCQGPFNVVTVPRLVHQ